MDWSRLKNYGLWVSILALIPLILKQFGIYIIPEEYTQIATAILSILVMAGILNNPTTENKGFLDDNIKNKKEIE
ncbi:phage holin [Clostridium thermobutyricum]|uniref:phage holin n=1 Tax=Clostridium thermobutyricum TaxID=29372 RepID=UPI0018AB7428|nr:phage holin [Clostridium thermobutyricum]